MPRSETRHAPDIFEDIDARLPLMKPDRLPRIAVFFPRRKPVEVLLTVRFDPTQQAVDELFDSIFHAMEHANKRLAEDIERARRKRGKSGTRWME